MSLEVTPTLYGAIHTFTRRRLTQSGVTEEGRPTTTNADISVTGRVCILSAKEVEREERYVADVEASILVPIDTDVTDADQIIVSGYGVFLDGTWTVGAVRQTPNHLRCLSYRRGT